MSVKHGSGKHGRITGCHRVTTVINIYPVFCYLGNKADSMKMYVFLLEVSWPGETYGVIPQKQQPCASQIKQSFD